jgi:hypothetical protein
MFGVEPPDDTTGDVPVTAVTVPLPVALIVTDPAPLVILTPDPAVKVVRVKPVPLPISI